MNSNLQIKGLWVPLITPFFQGQLDKESLIRLITETASDVDGYVPCLSSGEGDKMKADLWEQVVTIVIGQTATPVAAGILDSAMESIVRLSKKAKDLGCIAVAIPLQGENAEAQRIFCKELSAASSLPIILYNTEAVHIDTVDVLMDIANECPNIVSIKDSSQNTNFFQAMIAAKKEGTLSLSILQGMENQLLESVGCDGYLISLANTESKLCKDMLNTPSRELNDEIMKKWDEFDLASKAWYVGIKEALFDRGIIKSKELMQ